MISYKIISRKIPSSEKRNWQSPLDPNSPTFKQDVFQRSLTRCHFRPQMRVRVQGTQRKGEIIEIEYDVNKMPWTATNIPQYLYVQFDDGEFLYCAPHQLTRKKAK